MDLNTIAAISRPRRPEQIPPWVPGDAPLAGGTWLFSEPQPDLRRLVDLAGLGWDECDATDAGLRIGAMCGIAALSRFVAPAEWHGAAAIAPCCDSLVAAFKVQAVATVGGNLCLALAAGPMAALAVAMQGVCTLRAADGERTLPALDFVTGPGRTALRPGELLRQIFLPSAALSRRVAFRRMALSPLGRSAALLIGTRGDGFALTVTAATTRPVRLAFATMPDAGALHAALDDAIPDALLHDDVHGDPPWRRHITRLLAEDVRRELSGWS